MNQLFEDNRGKIFARYRKKVQDIFEEDKKYWWKPENGTELYFEYLKRNENAPIPQELIDWFRLNGKRIPSSDTITKRLREIKEEVRAEEREFAEKTDLSNPENLSKYSL
jgi:hypothetical protein